MADETTANGNGNAADSAANKPQINVLGQYIKDLSFENPNAPKSLQHQGKNPSLNINFNVQAQAIGENMYEVALKLEASAKLEESVLYNMELLYAGGFRLQDLPQQAIRPVLFVECPALLFPFARRLVADLTREGGFPPLLLDPIDFAALYRQQAAQQDEPEGQSAVVQ